MKDCWCTVENCKGKLVTDRTFREHNKHDRPSYKKYSLTIKFIEMLIIYQALLMTVIHFNIYINNDIIYLLIEHYNLAYQDHNLEFCSIYDLNNISHDKIIVSSMIKRSASLHVGNEIIGSSLSRTDLGTYIL